MTQPCDHLRPVIKYLHAQGVTVTEGLTWGLVTVKLDCAQPLDVSDIQRHVAITPPLEAYEIRQPWFPEAGIMCMEHHHTIAWPLPPRKQKEAPNHA